MSAGAGPRFIFHVAAFHDWMEAKQAGEYRFSTLGHKLADGGFMHACTAEQLGGVANAMYRGARGLVLLVIDPRRVKAEIRYETASSASAAAQRVASEVRYQHPDSAGESFPHIYGPLNVDAVREALPFEPGPDGRFTFPRAVVDQL